MAKPDLDVDIQSVIDQVLAGDAPVSGITLANKRHSRELQYWKLCDRPECQAHQSRKGWVTVGPALQPRTAVEYTEFMEYKHATPLPQYGKSATKLSAPEHRFDLLIENRGFHELPMSQMLSYGWHRRPLMVKLIPELEEFVGTEIYCEHGCEVTGFGARWFLTVNDYKAHIEVKHSEVRAPMAMGTSFERAVEKMIEAQNLRANSTLNLSQEDLMKLAMVTAMTLKEMETK